MNEYERLRARAKLNRDKVMEKARDEYRAEVKKIKELERRLGGKTQRSAFRSLMDVIRDALPRDRLFTINEVIERAREPADGTSDVPPLEQSLGE